MILLKPCKCSRDGHLVACQVKSDGAGKFYDSWTKRFEKIDDDLYFDRFERSRKECRCCK